MNSIEFARNLFALRMEHGYSVEALAEAMELSPELICEWECAKTSPTLDNMMKLASVYGISLVEIVRPATPHEYTGPIPEAPKEEVAEEEPIAEENDEDLEEEEEFEEFFETPEKRGRPELWEILVIVILLFLIGSAVFFLFRPDLFPLTASLLPKLLTKIPLF